MSNKINDKLKETVNKENIKNEFTKGANSSKKFLSGFRDFINRGNVLDLAVGVIIGGAFSDIVKSFINNIISPIIKVFNKFKKEKPKEEPKKSDETKLLEEILVELKKQNKD